MQSNGRDAVTIAEELYSDVGTYLKVVRFAEPSNPDGFIVLYLRPDSRFLFLGYWAGYERTAAAGVWSKSDRQLSLRGRGIVAADFVPGGERRHLERVLTLDDQGLTPTLVADNELEGWSLLSWRGPFAYVGKQTIIDPDRQWLPDSLPAVEAWIDRIT